MSEQEHIPHVEPTPVSTYLLVFAALAIGTLTPRTVRVVWAAPPPKPTSTPAAPVRIRCSAAW